MKNLFVFFLFSFTALAQPQENVLIVGFESYYLAGEKLNLSAFVQDVATQEATTLSVPLYVELIDLAQGKLTKRFILKLERGEAILNYTLPINLQTGNYQIRAYTNLMRNFSQLGFFKHNFTIFSQNYLQEIPKDLREVADTAMVILEDSVIEKGIFEIEKGLILKGTIQKITGKPNKKEVKLAVILQEIATEQKNTQHFVKNCRDKFIFENIEFYDKQSITFIAPNNKVNLDTTNIIPKIIAQNLPINWNLISKSETKEELQKREEDARNNYVTKEDKNSVLNEVIVKSKKIEKDNYGIQASMVFDEKTINRFYDTSDLIEFVKNMGCGGVNASQRKIFINGIEFTDFETVNPTGIEKILILRDVEGTSYNCGCAIIIKQRYGNTFAMKKINDSFVVEGYYR